MQVLFGGVALVADGAGKGPRVRVLVLAQTAQRRVGAVAREAADAGHRGKMAPFYAAE